MFLWLEVLFFTTEGLTKRGHSANGNLKPKSLCKKTNFELQSIAQKLLFYMYLLLFAGTKKIPKYSLLFNPFKYAWIKVSNTTVSNFNGKQYWQNNI